MLKNFSSEIFESGINGKILKETFQKWNSFENCVILKISNFVWKIDTVGNSKFVVFGNAEL